MQSRLPSEKQSGIIAKKIWRYGHDIFCVASSCSQRALHRLRRLRQRLSPGAIKMVSDKEGFLYPDVTEACVHCGHCTHICPMLKHREQRPDPTVFAVWNENDEMRRHSTSGGAFAAIASFVLESGGVVFGAAMDSDMRVVHTAIQAKEDLPRLMGAKLVQSDMGECFQQVRYYLDRGMDVFFTGTPCQVDGLYRFLGESPERLLTADVLCSGVPSPGVWSKTVEAMHYIKQRRVKTVQFCKKTSGADSRFVVDFEGGGQYDAPLTKSDYGRGLFRGAVSAARLLSLPLLQHKSGSGPYIGYFSRPAGGF